MPINCLIKFWTVMFKKSIHGQFVNNSWTFMFHKTVFSSFALCLFHSFPLSSFLSLPLPSSLFLSLSLCLFVPSSLPLLSSLFLSLPLLLSFFNVRSANPANSLKTRDLRKRHFWLRFLSQGKSLKLKTLGAKFAHYFSHFPADPTLHTPPETDPTCSAAKPYIM